MKNKQPRLGDLRVWWNRFDNKGNQYYKVPSIEVACGVFFGLSMSDLENNHVGMNAGGMEIYEDIEDGNGPSWNEWYHEETGDSIDQYSREQYPDMGIIKE